MEINELIKELERACINAAQSEYMGCRTHLESDVRKLIEQYKLDERIKNGQEKMYVVRIKELNSTIIYPERIFDKQPFEWLYKMPSGLEIKLSKSMFKEEKIDIDKIGEEIKKQQNGENYDADFLEKNLVIKMEDK